MPRNSGGATGYAGYAPAYPVFPMQQQIHICIFNKKKRKKLIRDAQGQATGRPRRGSASVTLRPTRPMQPDAQTTTLTGLRSQYRSAQRICSTSTIPSFALLVPVRGYAVTASRRRTHATELPIAVADA